MSVTVMHGDCRDVLRTLPDGRFQKGERRSPATEFKRGVHAWRPKKPHWDKEWLLAEYVAKQRSAGDIAKEIGTTDANVIYWLRKHGIPRRTTSAARAIKHWGVVGEANPMYGKRGAESPTYIDGSSPERQRLYARSEGAQLLASIYARDGWTCRRCGEKKGGKRSLHAHHIKPWAGNPALRFDPWNLISVCKPCHLWIHSRKNASREFLA